MNTEKPKGSQNTTNQKPLPLPKALLIRLRPFEWLLDHGLYILITMTIIGSPFLYVWTPTQTSKYLMNKYQKNWKFGYIVDIRQKEGSTCDTNFDEIIFGYWSGVKEGSCLCKNSISGIQFATESKAICSQKQYKNIFECTDIPATPPLKITKYKGGELCVRRMDSLESFNNFIKNSFNTKFNKKEYNNYINYLINSSPFENINDVVLDIKIINPSNKTAFESAGYQTVKGNSSDINPPPDVVFSDGSLLMVLYGEAKTIFDVNDLIADIHLSNHGWCAYNDMSDIEPESTKINYNNYIDYYGHEYCNRLSDNVLNITNTNLYYTDNFKRSFKINSLLEINSPPPSRADFYTEIDQTYYTPNGITYNRISPSYQPYGIAERFLYGIGCQYMISPNDHLIRFENVTRLKQIAMAAIVFNLMMFFLSILFLIFRVYDNGKDYTCTYLLLSVFYMGATMLSFVLLLVYFIFGKTGLNYFYDFNLYCQTDFAQKNEEIINMGSAQELQMLEDIENVLNLCLTMVIFMAIVNVVLCVNYVLTCSEHKMMYESRYNYNEDVLNRKYN